MTTASSGTNSMKFSLDEVLQGMLASVEQDSFTDDTARLASMFEGLAATVALFAPMAAGVDPQAVAGALKKRMYVFLPTILVGRTLRFWLVLAGVESLLG